jgi:hypothetical protein
MRAQDRSCPSRVWSPLVTLVVNGITAYQMLHGRARRMATMPAPVLTAMIDPERQEAPDFRRVP